MRPYYDSADHRFFRYPRWDEGSQVRCPECGAPAGYSCLTKGNARAQKLHRMRYAARELAVMPVKPSPSTIEFAPHATLTDLADAVGKLLREGGDPDAIVRATTGISLNRHGGVVHTITVTPHDQSRKKFAAPEPAA